MADYLSVVYNSEDKPYTDYPRKLANFLFEVFEMKPGMKILEPGCGRGEFLRAFKDLGMEAYGLDISEETRELLKKDKIELTVCDVESEEGLPFSNDYFDVIYNKSFLEHLKNPENFMKEANRVLRPGGLLLCLVPDWEANYKIYFDDFTHRTPFTVISLNDIYNMSDFEGVDVSRFRQLPLVWKYPILNYLCAAISPLIPVRTKNKFFRWSRELMLLGAGFKPH